MNDSNILAHAIVDTVRESLMVLDGKLRVIAASRSFYNTFKTSAAETIGRNVYDLGTGEWNNESLRLLLDRIIPEHSVMNNFEIEQVFPTIGLKTMLLNARKVFYEDNDNSTLLLSIEDVTDRRIAERALQNLMIQKDMLLAEMGHRVANSLQIVASILMMKARSVQSSETRGHLEDAHRRVMSVALLQQHLKASTIGERVEIKAYLRTLCETLTGSMIGEASNITISLTSQDGSVTSDQAVSIGLIVTELVINALKHAFPDRSQNGHVKMLYTAKDGVWQLSVSDDGVGMQAQPPKKPGGLGTSLVKALCQQLDAEIKVESSDKGTSTTITHVPV